MSCQNRKYLSLQFHLNFFLLINFIIVSHLFVNLDDINFFSFLFLTDSSNFLFFATNIIIIFIFVLRLLFTLTDKFIKQSRKFGSLAFRMGCISFLNLLFNQFDCVRQINALI